MPSPRGGPTMRYRAVSRAPWALLLVLVACDPSVETAVSDADRSHVISLGSGVIDTRVTPPDAPTARARGGGAVLIKFPAPATAAQLEALAASATIYTYLPHDTFLVRPHGASLASLGASWTGDYRPDYKVSRNARDVALAA